MRRVARRSLESSIIDEAVRAGGADTSVWDALEFSSGNFFDEAGGVVMANNVLDATGGNTGFPFDSGIGFPISEMAWSFFPFRTAEAVMGIGLSTSWAVRFLPLYYRRPLP